MKVTTRRITSETAAYDFIRYYNIWNCHLDSNIERTNIIPIEGMKAIVIANAINQDIVQRLFYGATVYKNLVANGDYGDFAAQEFQELNHLVLACLESKLEVKTYENLTNFINNGTLLEKLLPNITFDRIELLGKVLIYGYQEKTFTIKESCQV